MVFHIQGDITFIPFLKQGTDRIPHDLEHYHSAQAMVQRGDAVYHNGINRNKTKAWSNNGDSTDCASAEQ